ncbi:hypothetical protein CQZ93_24665 [Ochrobactrum vermis]|nr:hypothetical protein CQZ93_24665 [Ochrobactrum vermis]
MCKGEWLFLYGAIENNGDMVEVYFSRDRDLTAAKRFLLRALAHHGRRSELPSTEARPTEQLTCNVMLRINSDRLANPLLSAPENI